MFFVLYFFIGQFYYQLHARNRPDRTNHLLQAWYHLQYHPFISHKKSRCLNSGNRYSPSNDCYINNEQVNLVGS